MLLCIDLKERETILNLLSSYIVKEDFITDDVIDIGDDTQIINIIVNILKQNKIKYSLEKH
mgnify:CR=1 FL=1|jgi:hypothetical protein